LRGLQFQKGQYFAQRMRYADVALPCAGSSGEQHGAVVGCGTGSILFCGRNSIEQNRPNAYQNATCLVYLKRQLKPIPNHGKVNMHIAVNDAGSPFFNIFKYMRPPIYKFKSAIDYNSSPHSFFSFVFPFLNHVLYRFFYKQHNKVLHTLQYKRMHF
jgi:hypothetical protein